MSYQPTRAEIEAARDEYKLSYEYKAVNADEAWADALVAAHNAVLSNDKTREEMIEDVAWAIAAARKDPEVTIEEEARAAVDAALAPRKPGCPSQEAIDAARIAANKVCKERGLIPFSASNDWNAMLRAALLAADEHNPIVQAAIELVREYEARGSAMPKAREIVNVVKNAGKL